MEHTNTHPSLKTLLILIGAIVVVFLAIIGVNEYTLYTGEEMYLKTAPVDPRDILRGDYVILRYDFEESDILENYINTNNIGRNTPLYLSFEKDSENLGTLISVSEKRPNSGIFMRVKTQPQSWWRSSVETGIGKYFVPEGTGRNIERIRGDMTVKVKVDTNGTSRIIELYYKGEKIDPKTFIAPTQTFIDSIN